MTNTESRIRAALKAELEGIEPSPVSWDLIRRGQTQQPHPRGRRRLVLAAATAAAAAIVVVALVMATSPDGGRVTDVAPTDSDQPGLVVDEIGDAQPAHLDLASVGVQAAGDRLRITWTLAGPVPAAPSPVDYRVAFVDAVDGGDPVVVLVRFDEETRAVAIGRCRPEASGIADCTDRTLRVVAAQPQVDGDTVSVTIPSSEVEIPVDRLTWTAHVMELR